MYYEMGNILTSLKPLTLCIQIHKTCEIPILQQINYLHLRPEDLGLSRSNIFPVYQLFDGLTHFDVGFVTRAHFLSAGKETWWE